MRKKGSAEKIVLDVIKKEPKSILEIKDITGLAYSTIKDIVSRLKEKTIEEVSILDEKEQSIKKYKLLIEKNVADPEFLHFLMKSYKSSLTVRNELKQSLILRDISMICSEKKIRDVDFVEFLIKYSRKEEKFFWIALGMVSLRLIFDIETEKSGDITVKNNLLNLIRNTGEFFEKIVFNYSKKYSDRVRALDTLENMSHPNRFNVAFKLLEEVDTEKFFDGFSSRSTIVGHPLFSKERNEDVGPIRSVTELDIFKDQIESLIRSYAEISPTDCRKRLYALLDANLESESSKISSKEHIRTEFNANKKRKIIREEIRYLLVLTEKM